MAEADVYLAYGRDQQAEEILREALRTHPDRLAVHSKLLEIHAKRRDNKAFENAALVAFTRALGSTSDAAGVRVVGVSPGPVASDRLEYLVKRRAKQRFGDEGRSQEILANMPF